MSNQHSDALVFFGATGDLAYKKIFPALQGMLKRGHLNVPVIGVAKSGWNLEQFKARAHDSLEKHGGVDPAAFEKLCGLLRYIDGDYEDPGTFKGTWRSHAASLLPGNPATPIRVGHRAANEFGLHARTACHRRETLRPRPRICARTKSDSAWLLCRGEYLSHRSLPGKTGRK